MKITSTADVTLTNTSNQPVVTPLHGVITINNATGPVTMPEALGGPASALYNKYYYDLSSKLSGGQLAPGGRVTFNVKFVRASTVTFRYNVTPYGVLPTGNQAPVANAGANRTVTIPYGQTSVNVTLSGSGSYDPDGTITAYAWSGSPKPMNITNPIVSLTAGYYTFTLQVTDNKSAVSAPKDVVITVVKEIVNPPQISISPPPHQVAAGSPTPLNISVSATSPDGRSVGLTASPQLTKATFSAAPGLTANGNYAFQPDFTQTGLYLVTFTARDTYGIKSSSTIQINVTSTNRPPVLTLQATATVAEGETLKIPLTATDPDNDILNLTAAGLPANAVFVPTAGALTFTPTAGQAKVSPYEVTVIANDGKRSVSKQVGITVTAASGGGPLTLAVDPVESPTFLSTQRITGTVNGTGQSQPGQKSALIVGMSPTTGKQGETLSVSLTGDVSSYVTHFSSGSSVASFGTGITVKSLTVSGPTQAIALITIDPAATVGARSVSVTTGSETAVSINAFNVLKGQTTVAGRLVDPATGLGIAGATVVIQGTNITAITNASGYYTLQGVPTGQQILIINAANRELLTLGIDIEANTAVNLNDLKPDTIVFDPSAPPSASTLSVVGRGITDLTGTITVEEARKAIIDTMILVGGNEVGVLDAYGNQLNPNVTGNGKLSLMDNGVNLYAEALAKGETMSLLELLYEIRFAFQWNGTPPTFLQMLGALQTLVNEAWVRSPQSQFGLAHRAIQLWKKHKSGPANLKC